MRYLVLSFLFFGCIPQNESLTEIRVNQVGYIQGQIKQAIVVEPSTSEFQILDKERNVVFASELRPSKFWDKSGENVSIADFSNFDKSGEYILSSGGSNSYSFNIGESLYFDLVKASAKAFYYHRASTALDSRYAGEFAREAGHADSSVLIHPTAQSSSRPPGTSVSTPKGWYDAGDYNKYIVNSGITTYTMMLAFEQNKELFESLTWNIPESENDRPDLLDEIKWNLDWMLTMQDPADGGVYHKNTTASFEGFVTPQAATNQRYVVAKGTAATLDFAAVMARASVIYQEYDQSLSDQYLTASEKAWLWAVENPDVPYKNAKASDESPAIVTGEYGDNEFNDEFFWAASELFLSSGDSVYGKYLDINSIDEFAVPNWSQVETLGLISIANSPSLGALQVDAVSELKNLSDDLLDAQNESPYGITLNEFRWGSNSDILNQGMVLINTYRLTNKQEYLNAAISSLDYVLGKNATGFCFLTGYGAKYPRNIHHRPSASDDVDEPIPGLLAGGPNPRNIEQDCGADMYPVHLPAKCFIDEECSYSTNEVAINWNAPMVYVTASIQSLTNSRIDE